MALRPFVDSEGTMHRLFRKFVDVSLRNIALECYGKKFRLCFLSRVFLQHWLQECVLTLLTV